MYQDFKGFVHADKNGICGLGYHSLADFVKNYSQIDSNFSLVGLNVIINSENDLTHYAIVKNKENNEICKMKLKPYSNVLNDVFKSCSLMIYDTNVEEIPELEDIYILGTLREI